MKSRVHQPSHKHTFYWLVVKRVLLNRPLPSILYKSTKSKVTPLFALPVLKTMQPAHHPPTRVHLSPVCCVRFKMENILASTWNWMLISWSLLSGGREIHRWKVLWRQNCSNVIIRWDSLYFFYCFCQLVDLLLPFFWSFDYLKYASIYLMWFYSFLLNGWNNLSKHWKLILMLLP